MARALRHPATMMVLVGLAVLGLALCCLGGSVAFTTITADAAMDEPPAAAIVCVVVGAVALGAGVIGMCIAAVSSRRDAERSGRSARGVTHHRGMSGPPA